MKERIIREYPNSRYAQILSNTNPENAGIDTPEVAYNKLYKMYESGDYRLVNTELEKAVDQFTGEELVSKFELLKANTIGKLKGIIEFKKALNFVALNYPNTEEGKQAEALIGKDVPYLEGLKFYAVEASSWKILFKVAFNDHKNNVLLINKIKKFIATRPSDNLFLSTDVYTMNENFIVIHGMITEEFAKGIATILKDYKDYKIPQASIVISNYNYQVVQINKNIDQYLTAPVVAPDPISIDAEVPQSDTETEVPVESEINPVEMPDNMNENQPPSIKGDGNLEPVLEQGNIERDQIIKPKK